jgi:hypothetical protein
MYAWFYTTSNRHYHSTSFEATSVQFTPPGIQHYINEPSISVSNSNFSGMLLNNMVTPTIVWHQAMSYLSVPIPAFSSLNDAAKLPKYLSKSAFYDNFIYFRHGSKAFITIQITDRML